MPLIYSYFKKLTILTLFLFSSTSWAVVPTWQIMPNKSTLLFSAMAGNVPINGRFKLFSGNIQFDPNDLKSSSVTIVIDLSSVASATNNPKITDTLKGADWFDVRLFPQALFHGETFVKSGKDTYEVIGTLSIHNREVPIGFEFVLEEYHDDIARATGTILLQLSDFGLGSGDTNNNIKDDVQVTFTLNTVKK